MMQPYLASARRPEPDAEPDTKGGCNRLEGMVDVMVPAQINDHLI